MGTTYKIPNGHVRVTLEAPALWDPIIMRFGTDEATLPAVMQDDEYVMDVSRPLPKVVKGKPITYALRVTEPCVMPIAAAMMYFGNWEIPEQGTEGSQDQEMIHGHERMRVARMWGDYHRATRSEAGLDGVPNGWRNLPKVAIPDCPHVRIEKLDANFQPIEGFVFRPHERYKWEADLQRVAPRPAAAATPGLITMTEAQLQAFIAQAVDARLDAATAPQKKAS